MAKATKREKGIYVKPLDFDGLVNVIMSVPKGQYMTITAETSIDSKMSKKNKEWLNRIVKRSTIQAHSWFDYCVSVENKAKELGVPVPEVQNRKHGFHLKGTPFIVSKPKNRTEPHLLLPTDPSGSLGYKYIDTKTGEELDKDFVHSLFTPYYQKPAPVAKNGRYYRDYGLENIVLLSANGKDYVIAENFKYSDTKGRTLSDVWEEMKEHV